MIGWRTILSGILALPCLVATGTAGAETAIHIHYLTVEVPPPPTLSDLDTVPDDAGVAGARLGLADNATTGQFLGHVYSMNESRVPVDGDIAGAARAALAQGDLLVLDAPAAALTRIADLPEASDALLFNIRAGDAGLRATGCRANLLHTAPSLSMRTDALAQFFLWRRWTELAMIAGGHPDDQAFAAAMEASLSKFGLKTGARAEWRFDADMRRNASEEVPLFTQGLGDYDVLIVADEIHDFARYVLFNTWHPRPVAGSEGLTAEGWAPVVEAWGAAQLQSRFRDAAGRPMRPDDYAAWAAIRAIGEAVTRAGATDAARLREFMLSDRFELAGFKGRPLTFRDWNGQLRQPIALTHPRALVATAPLEGFLHQTTELDTLGLDRAESGCTAFD